MLSSRQCEVALKAILPKLEESTKETKDQVKVSRLRSSQRNVITSHAKNYSPHVIRGTMKVRPNKWSLHEYQDRYKRP
ncbi:unnamed protein product [Prunus armeniaca]